MSDHRLSQVTFEKGKAPPVVEEFEISGLHGYRNIGLSSSYSATILIAQNGSGKTTLLGVLDAFLKLQFTRLRDLTFREIRCKLKGSVDTIVFTHDDLAKFFEFPLDGELQKFSRRVELDANVILNFVLGDFTQLKDDYSSLSDEPVFESISRKIGYRYNDVVSALEKVAATAFDHVPRVKFIAEAIRTALEGIEIVYLPTYRRVEIPYTDDPATRPYRRRKSKVRFPAAIFTGDIQFGLGDISERLSDINQQILVNSNRDYRKISAGIINELIDGTFEREEFDSQEIPSKEELNLFFSRLKEGRRMGPFNDVSVPNLDKIYSGADIPLETNKFLRYFLSKLNTVIQATREIEIPVEIFRDTCNKYLSAQDSSASIPNYEDATEIVPGIDGKVLRLDRKTFKVFAESVSSKRKIDLDALSSGEKQMISMFAKLILYPKRKIVLIDEPELSLSLDWQKQILPDVLNAPLCLQVIAITHSPFIFDNSLEPFARSLRLSLDPNAPATPVDDDAELGDL